MKRLSVLLYAVFLMGSIAYAQDNGDWIPLFDGNSLDGWVQRNGTATYRVEDGTIVGRTSDGSPNSFLCTKRQFGDFELQFEVRVHPRLNSGVQIRSRQKTAADLEAEGRNDPVGRVFGPQVEIEESGANGAEAGYVYGEATGLGWLTEEDPPRPHKHFKNGQWNRYRVLAQGPRIRTWINGTEVDDLTHEEIYRAHPKGFIGLQVHGIDRSEGPYEVAWRDIRLKEL